MDTIPRPRLLLLTRYTRLGSSSRLRFLQYQDALGAAGFEIAHRPFFDDAYLRDLYAHDRRAPSHLARAFARRLRDLAAARHSDLIWVEKEIFPFLPGAAESLLARLGRPYIVDYDDATFHRYDTHPSPLARALLGRKLRPLIRGARLITAGNAYLGDYARACGAQQVVQLPTVVDPSRYRATAPAPLGARALRIGWIGSPSTTPYLDLVAEPLARFAAARPACLVAIGAGTLPPLGLPVEAHPWSEATEAALLETIDLGLMPVPDAPFERGKCGYKLIQYLACGRPVIASPVGMNRDLVSPEVGLLATTGAEWLAALERLAADDALRQRMGRAGRTLIERHYSLQAVAPRVVGLFRDLLDRSPP